MGDTVQTEGDVFVANATPKEETASTPPAGGATPTEAVEEQGAAGLTGDESPDEVTAYLKKKYEGKLSGNDIEQVLRWRNTSTEAKTLKAEAATLKEAADRAKAQEALIRKTARQLGPESMRILDEEGLEAWEKYAFEAEQAEPEKPVLNPNDPKDKLLIELQKRLDAMDQERQKTAQQREMEEAATRLYSAVDAVELPDDEQKTVHGVLAMLTEFGLATGQFCKNPQNPTDDEIADAVKRAKTLLSGVQAVSSSEAQKKAEKVTPKTPTIKAEGETTSVQPESDDWVAREKRGFIERATRG